MGMGQKFTFSVESEFAVVGRNSEYADMDNPDGDIIAERFFMVATDAEGHQYRYGWEKTPEAAEFVFQNFAPEVFKWPLWRCEYMSIAWIKSGGDRDQLDREMEYDIGPDWMNSPEITHEVLCATGRY